MSISLVLATLNRRDELRGLFQSLREQRSQDFEILLADQNPDGFLDAILREFQELHIRHYRCRPCGLSQARNSLLDKIEGDLVAFPDDDCHYAPDTLEMLESFFMTHPEHHVVVGTWAASQSHEQPLAHDKVIKPLTLRSAFLGAGTIVQYYRRQVVDAVGPFDERLGPGTGLPYGCGEDTDYLLRAMAAGFSVVRHAGIRSYHPLPLVDDPAMAPKWQAYGQGRMYLLRKHNMPLWFKLANVAYPLVRAAIEGPKAWNYRRHMFLGRLKGLSGSHEQ